MAIAQPGKKEDAWDKVAKALSIANQGVGIVGGIQSIRKSSNDMEVSKTAQENEAQGIMTPVQKATLLKDQSRSEVEVPGATRFHERQEDGTLKPYWLSPKTKATENPAVSGALSQKDLNAWEQGGGLVVPAGTKKSRLSSVMGPDGKIQQVGLIKPEFSDPNAVKAPLDDNDKRAKLSSSDKQRYDNVVMANDAVGGMAKALQAGGSRYSLIGDNDYTASLARFKEAIGRMQSGGAIQKDEATSFMNLARNLGDDPAMQLKKLQELQGIMKDRYQTLGFDPSKNERFAYKVEGGKNKGPSELVNGVVAGDLPKVGKVEDGHIFKGGDPADPKNWKKVK